MEKYIQIYTTTNKKESAESISQAFIEKRLAACAQVVGPIKSTYWWQGAIEQGEEWLCLIKSKFSLYKQIEETIKKMHPYTVPEIIAVPVLAANPDYLSWMDAELDNSNTAAS